ncbi:MAG TPA: acylphosphatase [Candidatus Wildermuthbacteria bacterium]|uniref:acylphosphatase n=2 Tax=Parcubacteria group TaxID=1794811 RepID=A0A837IPF4_9BACT|nr:MAG: Acylphosphatase [Candidatus Yanofskybacteria bacterium GW2011_GWC1_48_11]KKW03962.1 MAG: Acylphosphatase [Parcubacteria group bacterium GW2011_GWB1_49_12]KKW08692.1 MAG: Acylphosphatase [Parcubacteria group bacterium GW2011_GWA1_49_26]KKW13952.1 MAG: Acylphosphatase [Parcubacteria group bacterium GW2011_GWA2_50_10]OHA61641.1 MAG: acylphosphatase [Candidatus Wildermuthbacteria bacterium GWA1_49_26]OHA65359.1 MAG: acylphosphatase [Candidatus Wildermuthbacteria bacterium RIFCSPHIGHO2_01_F
MEKMRVHLFVYGRVQGVFFRAGAQKRARKLGLTGWAHNLIDGRVELVAEGEKGAAEQFVQWCREGTPLAKVDRVDVRQEKCTGEFEDFSIHEFGF